VEMGPYDTFLISAKNMYLKSFQPSLAREIYFVIGEQIQTLLVHKHFFPLSSEIMLIWIGLTKLYMRDNHISVIGPHAFFQNQSPIPTCDLSARS
jgi:hypothetical protein